MKKLSQPLVISIVAISLCACGSSDHQESTARTQATVELKDGSQIQIGEDLLRANEISTTATDHHERREPSYAIPNSSIQSNAFVQIL